jgi:hypothetical protein
MLGGVMRLELSGRGGAGESMGGEEGDDEGRCAGAAPVASAGLGADGALDAALLPTTTNPLRRARVKTAWATSPLVSTPISEDICSSASHKWGGIVTDFESDISAAENTALSVTVDLSFPRRY